MLTPENFFKSMDETTVVDFLKARTSHACIITDERYRKFFDSQKSKALHGLQCGICDVNDIDNYITVHGLVKNYYVLTSSKEQLYTSRLSKLHPDRRFYSIKNDIIPYLISSRTKAFFKTKDNHRRLPQLSYAVVCIPRSGSTYFCDQLQGVGLGAPREHLRPPLISLLQHCKPGDFNFQRFIAGVYTADGKSGVFGTKVISHFLFKVLPFLNPTQVKRLALMNFKLIYLYREDKVLQSISHVVAQERKLWNTYSDEKVTRLRNEFIEYNFGKIYKSYNFLIDQEKRLADLLSMADRYLPISYEADVDHNIASTIKRVTDFIGCRPSKSNVDGVVRRKLRNELSFEYADRFSAEYRSAFGKDPERCYRHAAAA